MSKKKINSIIFLVLLLSSIFPLVSPPKETEGVFNSFSPSNSNENINTGGGIGSSEEDNIDSFNVHPINRWTEVVNIGTTVAVNDGVLNITDTGDGSVDYVRYERALRDLDGKVEIRFRVKNSANSGDNDRFIIGLFTSGGFDFTSIAELRIRAKNASQIYGNSFLGYFDVDGNEQTYDLDTSEVIWNNYWYILTIKYDLLVSKLSWVLDFANGTEVFDVDILDVSVNLAKLFEGETLYIGIEGRTTTNSVNAEYNVEYVKAPFKEREWTQTETPSDGDWLVDEWDSARVQDDVSDDSEYYLTVPYLDVFSGVYTCSFDIPTSMDAADNAGLWCKLYGVEANNGTRRELLTVVLGQFNDGTDKIWYSVTAGIVTVVDIKTAGVTVPRISFVMSLTEDRSVATINARVFLDVNSDVFDDFVGAVDISDYVFDPSQEFVVETYYGCAFTGDMEWTALFEDVTIIERNIFTDIGKFIEGVIGTAQDVVGGGADIFTALFRWLGGMLSAAFDVVGDALGVVIKALEPFLSAIDTAISTMQTAVTNAVGLIQGWLTTLGTTINGIIDDLQTGIGTIIADIETWLDNAVGVVEAWINGVFAFLVLAMADIIDEIITVLLTILADIIDVFVGIIFFLWDAVGLPDLLALVDLFIAAFVELTNAMPAFLNQVIPAILQIWALFAALGVIIFLILPCIGTNSVGEFIDRFLEYFFKDATFGISILGFSGSVPIGLLWMVTVISTVLSSTIFGGFF